MRTEPETQPKALRRAEVSFCAGKKRFGDGLRVKLRKQEKVRIVRGKLPLVARRMAPMPRLDLRRV